MYCMYTGLVYYQLNYRMYHKKKKTILIFGGNMKRLRIHIFNLDRRVLYKGALGSEWVMRCAQVGDKPVPFIGNRLASFRPLISTDEP